MGTANEWPPDGLAACPAAWPAQSRFPPRGRIRGQSGPLAKGGGAQAAGTFLRHIEQHGQPVNQLEHSCKLNGGAVVTSEYFETGLKKGRGRVQKSLDLIEAMYNAAEAAQPITGRGYRVQALHRRSNPLDVAQ
jgi:hypothetical protein